MSTYTVYNFALAALVLPLSCWLLGPRNLRRSVLRCARIALLMTLLGYPWDFFAINMGVWRYPRLPGYSIHGVPLNDLLFMWLCTHLACSVLTAARRWESGRERHSESKYASDQST